MKAAGATGRACSRRGDATIIADKQARDSLCLLNARVFTGDRTRPWAEAVAVGGTRITAVGTQAEARAVCGRRARVIDCEGGTILPGFIDAHIHVLALARSLSSVDLSPDRVDSIDALCARLRHVAARNPADTWIRGHGYDEFYLRERRHPTCRELDEAVPDRPVRLRHRTRHASVLNSAALRLITERAPDLLEAPGVERDPSSGEATGVLYDLDAALTQLLPRPEQAEIRAGLARASDLLLAAGVTAVDDASLTAGGDEVRLLREAVEEGVVRQRVRCLWGMERHGLPDDPSITAVKLAVREQDNEAPEFSRALMAAHRHGLQIAVHAVEGPAIAVALGAFESAFRRWPRSHRHRLEHCALCPPPLLDRIAELGLAVVAQPGFLGQVGERYLAELPASEQSWLYPLRSLRARGVLLAGSSDAPVGPVGPLVGVAAAVGRRTKRGRLVAPEEAISLEEALSLYGRGAAHVTQADGTRGWLGVGRVADLVVLRRDLTRVPVDSLGETAVAFVVIDGRLALPEGISRN
jgi:predicted amidohydrolase YtcJ